MKINRQFGERVRAFLGSSNFFWIIVGLLIVQAGWIALSGRYPMAFDEDVWLGIIRLYADHLSPFWSGQPPGADAFGAVARDPSYLYFYLMALPYKLISAFTSNEMAIVLILRAMNIGLFAWGLVLFRRLLAKSGAPNSLINFSLLTLVLIPVVPLLAAQINYDNLIFPLTALALLLAIKLSEQIDKRRISVVTVAKLLVLCLLASLVKYAFLPIFAAIVGFVLWRLWQKYRSPGKVTAALCVSWRKTARHTQVIITLLLLLSLGLFTERFGVNLARYHTPAPDCAQVLDYNHCQHYGPWIRDYNFEKSKINPETSPVAFTQHWFGGMWLRSFFAVDGPSTEFQTRGPLAVPYISSIALALASALALIMTAKRLWRRYNSAVLGLFVAAILVHTSILWVTQYQMFLQTGVAVAINGRYIVPVLPLLILIAVMAWNKLLSHRVALKLGLATISIACLLWGGGALTYILRSNDSWYWPNSPLKSANHMMQHNLGPLTPGYDSPTQFLP